MFLRCTRRVKDGKSHEYWNVVENRRLSDGRVVQRQVLYLGEINASQREAWRKRPATRQRWLRRKANTRARCESSFFVSCFFCGLQDRWYCRTGIESIAERRWCPTASLNTARG